MLTRATAACLDAGCTPSTELVHSVAVVQVVLSFYESKKRASSGWFGRTSERLCWEQWSVTLATPHRGTAQVNHVLRCW